MHKFRPSRKHESIPQTCRYTFYVEKSAFTEHCGVKVLESDLNANTNSTSFLAIELWAWD